MLRYRRKGFGPEERCHLEPTPASGFRHRAGVWGCFGVATIARRPGEPNCNTLPGGWETPEEAWPELQNEMLDNMVRLEAALKAPVLSLKLPDEAPEA